MMNLIATIMCFIASIFSYIQGNYGLAITNSVLTLLNLPFAINWIKKKIKHKGVE